MDNKTFWYASAFLAFATLMHPAHSAVTRKHQCTAVTVRDTQFVMLGKSSVIPLGAPVTRVIVDGPTASAGGASASAAGGEQGDPPGVGEMEVMLLSPTDLFFRGKRAGSTNVILQDAKGACYIQDIIVSVDPRTLQSKIAELLPSEGGVVVKSAENAFVLTGQVRDTAHLDEVLRIAAAYGDGKRVVNLLRVNAPQQVMLEVKIAEVSKNLLDRFDLDFSRMFTSADGLTSKVISGILGGGPGLYGRFRPNTGGGVVSGGATAGATGASAAASSGMATSGRGSTLFGIDAQKQDGFVRVLAEPNIMAISGQSASFLSGGKIFIPVAQSRDAGGGTITLEEKEFGVGLKFTPTVLTETRINLKLVSEVSELSQTGSPFTTVGGVTSVLPSITTRRIDTTVQLNDGESFAIAGLIRNNVTESLSRFPGLGEIPVLGALFRSTEFQKDQTELIFIVTPRFAKPLTQPAILPTDTHQVPGRGERILLGAVDKAGTAAPSNTSKDPQ